MKKAQVESSESETDTPPIWQLEAELQGPVEGDVPRGLEAPCLPEERRRAEHFLLAFTEATKQGRNAKAGEIPAASFAWGV